MLYPINIYVFQNGNKLDVSQEETIEINMGGISLLNLQQRTYTHTNSFSLPRTPNNEAELGYIGLKQVYAPTHVDVIIQRGLINLRGFITVLNTTESTIEVSFAYDDGGGFADLKNMNFYTMVYDETYPEFNNDQDGQDALLRYITAMPVGVDEKIYYAPHTAGGVVTAYDRDSQNSGGLVMRFMKFVGLLERELGITINGKTNIPPYLWVVNKWASFGVQHNYTTHKIQPFVIFRQNIETAFFSVSDVLKAFCQYHNLDFVQTSYNTFEFRTFATILANDPYVIDQEILEWQKSTATGLGLVNNITFKNNGKAFASISGNGEGSKELFKSLVSAPAKQYFPTSPINAELTGYNLLDCTDVIFLTKADPAYPESYYESDKHYEFLTGTINEQYYNTLTIKYPELRIAPAKNYYTIQLALRYPIIFDITIWLSNYDFEQVSQKRMVRSVVLGGDFFVEKMAYNVNTGNAILTLIKKW